MVTLSQIHEDKIENIALLRNQKVKTIKKILLTTALTTVSKYSSFLKTAVAVTSLAIFSSSFPAASQAKQNYDMCKLDEIPASFIKRVKRRSDFGSILQQMFESCPGAALALTEAPTAAVDGNTGGGNFGASSSDDHGGEADNGGGNPGDGNDKQKSNASEHNGKGGNDGKGGKDRDGSKNSDKGN